MGDSGSNTTKPLTPEQLEAYYNKATGLIGQPSSSRLSPFQSPGAFSAASTTPAAFTGAGDASQASTARASLGNLAPVTSADVATTGPAAKAQLGGYNPVATAGPVTNANVGAYDQAATAAFTDPGAAQRLFGGDYDALQAAIFDPQARDIAEQRRLTGEAADTDLARRGIYTSGAAAQTTADLDKEASRARENALSRAIGTRYDLQGSELGRLNDYALAKSDQANRAGQFNAEAVNRLNELVFGRGTDVSLANASEANRAGQFNQGEINRLNEMVFGRGTDVNLANVDRDLNAGQFNAGQTQQGNQFNAGAANQQGQLAFTEANRIALENANAANAQAQFNAGAANQQGQFNAGQKNQASQFNAGSANQASQFNAGQQNLYQQQTAQERNAYNVDAYQLPFDQYMRKITAFYGGQSPESKSTQGNLWRLLGL